MAHYTHPKRYVISTRGWTYIFDKPCPEISHAIREGLKWGDVYVNGELVKTRAYGGRIYWGWHEYGEL
jgi:hypothetical protein